MKIGKVTLNLKYYSGEDYYSDGDIEDTILEACKKSREKELLYNSNQYPVLYHLSDIRHNIIEWYPIKKSERVLEIGAGCGAITGILSEKAKDVTCVELSKKRSLINAYRHKGKSNIEIMVGNYQEIEPSLPEFDVITMIGVWEYSGLYITDAENPFLKMLELARKHLKPNGRIFIGIENKTGMKYFNGACEDHTGKMYSGLNDYSDGESARTFSRAEIEKMLHKVRFKEYEFYYPMPDYKLPNVIYSDAYLPKEGMIRDFGKVYDMPRFYHFLDAAMFDQVCHDDMFSYFANSFIISIGKKTGIVFAKYNRERKAEFRTGTVIKKTNEGKQCVIKYPLHSYAKKFVKKIATNERKWKKCSIAKAEGKVIGESYQEEFIEGTPLDCEFYELRGNVDLFLMRARECVDKIYELDSSCTEDFSVTEKFIEVFGDARPCGVRAIKPANLDLVFHNIKKTHQGNLVSFDFEWVFDFPIPIEYVAWRAMDQLYDEYSAYLKRSITKNMFMEAVGINRELFREFEKMEKRFGEYVMGENNREEYTLRYRKSAIMQEYRFY